MKVGRTSALFKPMGDTARSTASWPVHEQPETHTRLEDFNESHARSTTNRHDAVCSGRSPLKRFAGEQQHPQHDDWFRLYDIRRRRALIGVVVFYRHDVEPDRRRPALYNGAILARASRK